MWNFSSVTIKKLHPVHSSELQLILNELAGMLSLLNIDSQES